MTEEKKNELYRILVAEVEAAHKQGVRNVTTRYDLVRALIGWFGKITRDELEVVDRLHADNWIDE